MSNTELISNAAFFALIFIFLLTFTIIGAVYYFNRLKRFNQMNKIAILKSLEREREKISNDLHDAASSLIAEFTSKLLEIKNTDNLNNQTYEKINHLHQRIQAYNQDLSHNIEDIYPKELLVDNWAEAIQSLAFRFQTDACKIICDFGEIPNIKKEIQIQSYRAIQEILTNIIKHCSPFAITIQCYYEKKEIHVYFLYRFLKANSLNLPTAGRGTSVLINRIKFIKGKLSLPQKTNEQESFLEYEIELKFP